MTLSQDLYQQLTWQLVILVEGEPSRKSKIKKLSKEKARDKAMQTHTKDKDKK